MVTLSSDQDLLRQSLADPEVFGKLFDRYAADIAKFLARRAPSSVVEDLLVETFVVAFQNRSRFDFNFSNARPWLYGIATNCLRHHFRREERSVRIRRREIETVFTVSPEDYQDDVENHIMSTCLRPIIDGALEKLDPRNRDALLLYVYAELTYEEISQALQVPPGTVKSRIARARKQLRESLSVLEAKTGEEGRRYSNG